MTSLGEHKEQIECQDHGGMVGGTTQNGLVIIVGWMGFKLQVFPRVIYDNDNIWN